MNEQEKRELLKKIPTRKLLASIERKTPASGTAAVIDT